jgi:hypothetical protein
MAKETAGSPEQQLAETYAPIAELRQHEGACDPAGNGYVPAPIEIVLGIPAVALKQTTGDSSASDTVVKMDRAPPHETSPDTTFRTTVTFPAISTPIASQS